MCEDCGYKKALDDCRNILDEWPNNHFINSLVDWMEENEHVTEKQLAAIKNTRNGMDQRAHTRPRRR